MYLSPMYLHLRPHCLNLLCLLGSWFLQRINHELQFTPTTASLPPFRGANSISNRGKLHISRGGGDGSGNGGGGVLGLQSEQAKGAMAAAAILPSSSSRRRRTEKDASHAMRVAGEKASQSVSRFSNWARLGAERWEE